MRKDVRKAVSWIEDFMGKAAKEVERINSVRGTVVDEITDLQIEIKDLESDETVLVESKKKLENLMKVVNGS